MRVLMVADARSVHTRRWAVSLAGAGVEIVLFSIFPSPDDFFENHGIRLEVFDLFTYKKEHGLRSFRSMCVRHYAAVRRLKSLIKMFCPDILHAHYATSFGLIGALTGFHPFIVSVWGSDVYEFPEQSSINRLSVKYILNKADKVLSTSNIMARRTALFTSVPISVTPFGVDTALFSRIPVKQDGTFVVGNVKTLSPKYGIDVLIRSFKSVREHNPELKTVLTIVGEGPCRAEYERLAEDLGIREYVLFVGKVSNDRLPQYYNSFSVSVSLSLSESFGVVAVEAMSCGCPVVVSDADGFTEVVEDGVTGYIVPKGDPDAAASAIQHFIDNPSLRESMGAAGRARVEQFYDWNDNVRTMMKIYGDVRKS